MSSLKKMIYIADQEIHSLCERILNKELYDLVCELSAEQPSADYTIFTDLALAENIQGKGIFIGATSEHKKLIEKGVIAVLHPSQLEHEVGQVAFKRLLGENSSLGLETVFEKSKIQFKNFRLMDHLMMGHYSDVLAREAFLKGHKPLPIRNFFDTIASFLFKFEQEKRVSFPYDVDFGLWDDLFVMQIHCSAKDLSLEDFTSSFDHYDINDPQKGLLKLALSQTDSLDIYELKTSQRLVLCAQWFHPLRKKQFKSLYPSLYLHQIEKFSPYQGKQGKSLLAPLSAQDVKNPSGKPAAHEDVFEKIVHKLNQIDVEELTKLVAGDEQNEEGTQKVKAWLEVDENEPQLVKGEIQEDDSFQRVSGRIEEDDSFQRISGKIEEDNSFQVISGGKTSLVEEAWKIKREQIIENLKEKLSAQGDQSLRAEEEIQNVLQGVFHSNDKEVSRFARELVSAPQDFSAEPAQPKYDFDAKRAEQNQIAKDAQILRMKKLIDRMKMEIQARNTADSLKTHTKNDDIAEGLGAALVEAEAKRLAQDLKKQQSTHERVKSYLEKQLKAKEDVISSLESKLSEMKEAQRPSLVQEQEDADVAELEQQNETLKNQLEVSKKRISQMSDTILNNSRNNKEKENKELSIQKEALNKAQEAIKKFQSDLEAARRELKEKEAENKALMKHFDDVKAEEEITGPSPEKLQLEEMTKQVEELKAESKALNESAKTQYLEIKKLEQKNRFLTAQLETAQKKGPVVANNSQGKPVNDAQAAKKAKQLEKIVEAMKDNEQKLQQELISKKDDLQKMKAESISLKNKVADLERKLQKYEKEAA